MNTVNTMGKLPANEGAERALLGAVLLDNSANSQVNLLMALEQAEAEDCGDRHRRGK